MTTIMAIKTIADYDKEIREMAETMTTKQIAKEIGYSVGYTWTYCHENGIETQKEMTIPEKLIELDSEIRLLAETMSVQQIADEIGFNERYIYDHCRTHGIEPQKNVRVTINDYGPIIKKLAVDHTVADIAKQINYSEASVRLYCEENNVDVWTPPTIKDKKEEIIELAKTKTAEEIAEEIGYSKSSVVNYLITIGVRAAKKPRKQKPQHVFEPIEVSNKKEVLFTEYFNNWVYRFKKGVVSPATLKGYRNTYNHLQRLIPDVKLKDMTRDRYQNLLNDFAVDHSEVTVKDFHRSLRKSLVDAFYEGILKRDPTYNVVFKGYESENKKNFLNEKEVAKLLGALELDGEINGDHLLYLLIKTGARYAEGLGVTVEDFNFSEGTLSINKTLIYHSGPDRGKFAPTKNKTSNRVIQLDEETIRLFKQLTNDMKPDELVFGEISWWSTTAGYRLKSLTEELGIRDINVHGLRHTHASVLISNGAPILSVSERLGHSKPETTRNVYIHRTKELERKDKAKIRTVLSFFIKETSEIDG